MINRSGCRLGVLIIYLQSSDQMRCRTWGWFRRLAFFLRGQTLISKLCRCAFSNFSDKLILFVRV
jgi:hypothetical protein